MNNTQKKSVFSSKRITALVSFIIAVIFWVTITLVENPESTRIISLVPIYLDTANTIVDEQGLSIIGLDEKNAVCSVRISGASYVVNSVSAEDILVKPTFDDVSAAGKYTLKLSATNNTSKKFTIESVTPDSLIAQFDYIDTVSYDIQIKVKNAVAADGLILGTERFTNSDSASLEVSGPRSIVSRISTVTAVVSASKKQKLTATKSYDAPIKLYDSDGKTISPDGLTLSMNTISVSVPVLKTKTVPIKCTYTNKPGAYTPSATITVDGKSTSRLEIEGTPDIVDKTEFIELEPIDFYSVSKSSNNFEKKFVLPSGISAVNGAESATVKLATSSLKTKTFTVSSAVAVNNDSKFKVKLTQPIKVKICGLKSVIDSLKASNLYAEVDLDGKAVGDQTLSVTIKSRIKDNIWQTQNYEAKLSVTK